MSERHRFPVRWSLPSMKRCSTEKRVKKEKMGRSQRVSLCLLSQRVERSRLLDRCFVVSLIVIDHDGPVAPAFVLDHHGGSGGAVIEPEIAHPLHLPLLVGGGLEGVVCWGGGSFPLRR